MLIGDLGNQEKLLDYTSERTFHFLVFETSYRLYLFYTPLYLDIGSVSGILRIMKPEKLELIAMTRVLILEKVWKQ